MHNWQVARVVVLLVIVVSIPFYVVRESQRRDAQTIVADVRASFVGKEECIECHTEAYESWLGSHHDDAMDHVSPDSVRGDFNDTEFEYNGVTSRFYRKDDRYFVYTEGQDGEMAEFEVKYTFGVEPLQQYLVPFPGGRLQALSIAWDVERKRWFFLYPETEVAENDWMHWTQRAQNWNSMCAECHSTNLRKNFDAESNSYNTQWSEIDVSCEACHGPGSKHVNWAHIDPMGRPDVGNYELVVDTRDIDHNQLVELCAPCHSRRADIGDYDHSQGSFIESAIPSLLTKGIYYPDGQDLEENYVWGSFVQSKMYADGVGCRDCHDSHSLELHQEDNNLCLQCHLEGTYNAYSHHFHQKVVEGEPSDGALCVKCHMPERAFMVIDHRADHSMRVPRPDLSLEIGVPNACSQSGCHDDQAVQWSVDAYTKWYGQSRRPHFGSVLVAAQNGEPGAEKELHAILDTALYPVIVRATALSALQAYPGKRTNDAAQNALSDEDALIRVTAVDVIAPQTLEEQVALLGPKLFDNARAVRIRAAARLAGVGREHLTPFEQDAVDKELAEYVAATARNLDFAASGMNLGDLYSRLGDAEQAEHYYRMALAVDNMFFPAKMNLAVIVSQRGENEESEILLREVLADFPEQHDAAYALALLLVGTNRRDEGLVYLAQAADGMPKRSQVQYNYGLLLAQLNRSDEAESALRDALSMEPTSIDYLYALVDHYCKRDQLDKALELANQMIEAHPERRFGYEVQSMIKDRLNDPPDQATREDADS